MENLLLAFGDRYSEAERDRIVRGVYRHFCMMLMEMLHIPRKLHPMTWRDLVWILWAITFGWVVSLLVVVLLIAVANVFKDLLDPEHGSVVTISISTTRMAAENYGYMAPVKAALDSAVCFLAKSFAERGRVRFNAVGPGLLKSSASAGIPGYVDSYLFAEKATLRKQAVQTGEVANAVAFLLSPRSSGINAQHLVIDAGMGVNYFDRTLVDPSRT